MLDHAERGAGATVATSSHPGGTGDPVAAGKPHGDAAAAEASPLWRQLSHELRTPLNAILGNVELLLDDSAGPLSARARDCLADIQGAGQHLLRQVTLVQSLIEAVAVRQPATVTPVDVVEALRDAFRQRGLPHAATITPVDAALTVGGDPFWTERLAAALVELSEPGGCDAEGMRIALARPDPAAPDDVALRVSLPAGSAAPSAVRVGLVEAIVRQQGGRLEMTDAPGVVLLWPRACVIEPATRDRRTA